MMRVSPWYFYPTGLFPWVHTCPRNTHAPGKSRVGLEHKTWGAKCKPIPYASEPSPRQTYLHKLNEYFLKLNSKEIICPPLMEIFRVGGFGQLVICTSPSWASLMLRHLVDPTWASIYFIAANQQAKMGPQAITLSHYHTQGLRMA